MSVYMFACARASAGVLLDDSFRALMLKPTFANPKP